MSKSNRFGSKFKSSHRSGDRGRISKVFRSSDRKKFNKVRNRMRREEEREDWEY